MAAKLVCNVGFAMRRARRLRPGPRREVVLECLTAALDLIKELADSTPELARGGGLELLARLACRPSSSSPTASLRDAPVTLEDAPPVASERRIVTADVDVEFVNDMHVNETHDVEHFLHTQAPCVDSNSAVESSLPLTETGNVQVVESNCATTAVDLHGGRAIGKGIGGAFQCQEDEVGAVWGRFFIVDLLFLVVSIV